MLELLVAVWTQSNKSQRVQRVLREEARKIRSQGTLPECDESREESSLRSKAGGLMPRCFCGAAFRWLEKEQVHLHAAPHRPKFVPLSPVGGQASSGQ